MPVIEFGSKKYDEKVFQIFQRKIIHDLRQEELSVFAPKARVAQADTRAPAGLQEPPFVPFPFMKLPLELRTMVYKMHFAQPAAPHPIVPRKLVLSLCFFDELPFRRCPFRNVNGGVPVRLLWTVSKDLYHEAMPLYFQATEFMFDSLESLAHFLNVIGPYHRQHVTSVNLGSLVFDDSEDRDNCLSNDRIHAGLQALKLLRKCPALRHMKFNLPPTRSHMAETSEWFREILKIRGLRSVDVYRHWTEFCPIDGDFMRFYKHNAQVLEVLKQSYRPAVVNKRKQRGISNVAVPRRFFGPINLSEVKDWFDARESETLMGNSDDKRLRDTEVECLRQERTLVEASFTQIGNAQNQVLQPL